MPHLDKVFLEPLLLMLRYPHETLEQTAFRLWEECTLYSCPRHIDPITWDQAWWCFHWNFLQSPFSTKMDRDFKRVCQAGWGGHMTVMGWSHDDIQTAAKEVFHSTMVSWYHNSKAYRQVWLGYLLAHRANQTPITSHPAPVVSRTS